MSEYVKQAKDFNVYNYCLDITQQNNYKWHDSSHCKSTN